MAGLELVAVHFEFAVWLVSSASVYLGNGFVFVAWSLAVVLMVYLCDV